MNATLSHAAQCRGKRWGFIGGVGKRSISGIGYSVSELSDGSVILVVDGIVLDHSDEPITSNAFETFAHAGRMLTTYTQADRQRIIAEKHGGADCSLSGVRWAADGSYRGLDWS
jgi:hypothetical protein